MGLFVDRIKHAWNAFLGGDMEDEVRSYSAGVTYGSRPDRRRMSTSNEQSIINSIYTRIAIDVAAVDIRHVRVDRDGRFTEEIDSGLNRCLQLEANIDQAGRAFRQDIAATAVEHGVAAIVPVDTTLDPTKSAGYDIKTMRVGEIVAWMPKHIRVRLYNEAKGRREEITLPKKFVGIVENPLYSVMNETNSTLKRLIRKLNLLDAVDEQSASGRLDIIVQLPYVTKSESKRDQAKQRAEDLEFQLRGSKYGIAYTDSTEKITQLNRPAENNMLAQVEYLTKMLYGQLGLTEEIMNGTADEKAMLNYNNRTIEPIVTAIVEAMRRAFLTNTARTQGQSVVSFYNPFRLVPLENIADIADKLTRNEIVTSNEIRQIIGMRPSKDPKADKLVNSNMPQQAEESPPPDPDPPGVGDDDTTQGRRQPL